MVEDWTIDIFPENLEDILSYDKEVEGRVPDPHKKRKRYWNVKKGDRLVFRIVDKGKNPLEGQPNIIFPVEYNKKYSHPREMLEYEGLKRVLPKKRSIEEGVEMYLDLPGYKERIQEYGIYAIGLGKRIENE